MARKGTMYDRLLTSKFLNETITIKIYEPEIVNPLYETNVVIMHDGDDYFQLGRIATVSDKLHDNDEIVNTFFIGIHYLDRFDRLKKYHPDGELFAEYQRFLLKEVIPLLDELIPLNPLGINRTLMGDSLAGTLSLITALNNPALFRKVIMQSPLVNDQVLTIANNCEHGHLIEIYHSIGLDETDVQTTTEETVNFLIPNRELRIILKDKLMEYTYIEIEQGNHTWKYWQQEIPDVLIKMFN